MKPRRVAFVAVLCGTAALVVWGAAGLPGFALPDFENTTQLLAEDRPAISVPAEALASPQATAVRKTDVSVDDVATVLPVGVAIEAALPEPSPMLPPETPPVQMATANTPDPVQKEAEKAVGSIETVDECLVPEICIDQYLWSLYQRTPKRDTIKVEEQRKVTVKKKGKTRTVIEKFTKLVDEDFTWKDPKAAEKASMSLKDYVIGGMDRSFKLKLYHALRALDEAGLSPGITSAFRDDYRQSLVSGLKAATDRSYHGGSLRGGYGHGLAADLVSVKGETRAERFDFK